jgi:pyrroline-5-carboxylate reductase
VGIALWLEQEQQLDAVTAVSGSGPAYFFLLIEAMTAAGEKLGLPREIAEQLTLQTALGAARMAVASDVDAAELRRRVTSPAGTTEAAIKSFQANGFEAMVEQALGAAATAPPNWPNNWANKEPFNECTVRRRRFSWCKPWSACTC